MSDKSEATAALEAARRETLDAIDGIPEEKMATPAFGAWSVKDVLCHLASWEQLAVADLQRIARGERPVPDGVDYSDGDAWNARFVEARRNASPATVVAELRARRRQP